MLRDWEELGVFMRLCFFQGLSCKEFVLPASQTGSLCQTGQIIFNIWNIDGHLVRAGDWLSRFPQRFPAPRREHIPDSAPFQRMPCQGLVDSEALGLQLSPTGPCSRLPTSQPASIIALAPFLTPRGSKP